jgi:threonine/homoserine/homoserine lactone efflux protein
MLEYLTQGTLLGLAAGVAPGPLLVLVVTETIRHDTVAGVKVALAPMITDVPIITLAMLVLPRLPHFEFILGVVSIIGALFIGYLACESFRTQGIQLHSTHIKPQSLKRGVITNLLNPHPYVFWLGVGVPLIYRAAQVSYAGAAAFVGSFFVFIVGSKIVLALIVNKSRTFLSGPVYIYIVRALGLLLALFAFILVRDGLNFIGIGWGS